jgi:hypothetical protein
MDIGGSDAETQCPLRPMPVPAPRPMSRSFGQ